MPHSFGKRARTRNKYSRDFRRHGVPTLKSYLVNYRVGDHVDVICNPSVQAGMPYHHYHGRTGVVFNVTKRALGVEVNKVVGNREIRKKICIRIEHVRKSRCQEEFKKRVKENAARLMEAKKAGEKLPKGTLKRLPVGPREGAVLHVSGVEKMTPIAFVENY
eukprot:GHVU01157788.1.p1 GENE.GHVU01157788.1~~GHVU01157788.1.p1  ORF type:complete len:162 (+),score=21.00 GHVU01157788.1:116-601(+)